MLEASTAASEKDSAQRSAEARGPRAFVRRHALLSFYTLAYAMSWLAWVPYILSKSGLGVLQISFPELLGTTQLVGVLPGAYLGPLGAAFVVTAVAEGREGLRRWGGRLFRLGVGLRWYVLAFLGVPVLIMAGTLVLPGALAGLGFPPLQLLLIYVPFLLLQLLTTGLAEEPGWRDFALVRHQRQQGPLLGTLILGVLWAGWHLPLFLSEWGRGIGGANPRTILLFVAFCLVISVVITWVFNRTKGSLPLAILIHASNNNFASVLWVGVFSTLDFTRYALAGGAIGFGALALVLVAATRGRLGYRQDLYAGGPARNA